MRISDECRETKHQGCHCNGQPWDRKITKVDDENLKQKTCKLHDKQERASDLRPTPFGFASVLSKGKRKISGLITARSKEKWMRSRITFDGSSISNLEINTSKRNHSWCCLHLNYGGCRISFRIPWFLGLFLELWANQVAPPGWLNGHSCEPLWIKTKLSIMFDC